MSDETDGGAKSEPIEPLPGTTGAPALELATSAAAEAAQPAAPIPQEPQAFARVRDRRPRPLLGPWLWVSGVLLWAYVVMGIFTTSRFGPNRRPLGEGAAAFWVLVAWVGTALLALQRSLFATGGRPSARAAVIGIGSFALWVCFVAVAVVLGQLGFPDDFVSLFLVVVGAALAWYGRRSTNGSRGFSGENRLVAALLWIGAAVVTFAALVVR